MLGFFLYLYIFDEIPNNKSFDPLYTSKNLMDETNGFSIILRLYIYIKYLFVFCLHLIRLLAVFRLFPQGERVRKTLSRGASIIPGHVRHEQGVPILYIIDLTRIRFILVHKHFYDAIFECAQII